MTDSLKKSLGIDFGTKKVGIAVSSEDNNFAIPKTVLKNDKDLLENIEEIIEKENIGEIVIGESTNYKGEENPVMKDVKEFAGELETSPRLVGLGPKKFNLKIHFEPEFLTSHQAKSIQGETSMTDAAASALILQSFLDKRKNKWNII